MGTNFFWRTPAQDELIPGADIVLPTGEVVAAELRRRDNKNLIELWESKVSALEDMNPLIHIGKRSAAGPYCWDCGVTLCSGGESAIHMSTHDFLDACYKCGLTAAKTSSLSEGPVAVELGFAKPATERPRGVRGCSSFSWAQDPETVLRICRERPDETLIVDEYERVMTCAEFVTMLDANCPVRFTHSVGEWFS